jgi:hypothetical protein
VPCDAEITPTVVIELTKITEVSAKANAGLKIFEKLKKGKANIDLSLFDSVLGLDISYNKKLL